MESFGNSIGLRGATWSPVQTAAKSGVGRAALLALQMILAAGLAFFATLAALGGSWHGVEQPTTTDAAAPRPVQTTADVSAPLAPGEGYAVTRPAPQDARLERASIRIFTPRPGSIASGGPTRLCYAVSGALRARVEPGIGEVPPTNTLTCIRVAPARTTTYALAAYGRDGYPVRRQLVIVVR